MSDQRGDVDRAVRALWCALRGLSDEYLVVGEMPAADLDLWDVVTRHPAVQSRLSQMHQQAKEKIGE